VIVSGGVMPERGLAGRADEQAALERGVRDRAGRRPSSTASSSPAPRTSRQRR
jgi:hypothetical protein